MVSLLRGRDAWSLPGNGFWRYRYVDGQLEPRAFFFDGDERACALGLHARSWAAFRVATCEQDQLAAFRDGVILWEEIEVHFLS